MEELDLVQAWLENERELRPLLEKMLPLLEKRVEYEKKDPRLVALRSSKKELLPSEAASIVSAPLSSASSLSTILLDSSSSIPGLPPRPVPDMEKFQKMVEKRKAVNRKKHEKEKKKKEEAKKKTAEEKMDTEESEKVKEKQ